MLHDTQRSVYNITEYRNTLVTLP